MWRYCQVNRAEVVGDWIFWEDSVMKIKKHYWSEVKERAVRLVNEQQSEYPSQWAVIIPIAFKIGCTPETLRSWVKRKQINEANSSSQSTSDKERIKQLERENRELKCANKIMRLMAAFFPRRSLTAVCGVFYHRIWG